MRRHDTLTAAVQATESWRPIADFSGYEVSNRGRVRSHKWGRPHVRKPVVTHGGHLRVALSRDGKLSHHYVHRLVYEAFVGPVPDGLLICHRNGDPTDNRPDNLRADTQRGNMRDRELHGNTLRGLSHPRTVATPAQVQQIRRRYQLGVSKVGLARELGISESAVTTALRVAQKNPSRRQGQWKLSEDDVREIRALRGKFTQRELAERFGVSRGYIGHIQRGEVWGDIS